MKCFPVDIWQTSCAMSFIFFDSVKRVHSPMAAGYLSLTHAPLFRGSYSQLIQLIVSATY